MLPPLKRGEFLGRARPVRRYFGSAQGLFFSKARTLVNPVRALEKDRELKRLRVKKLRLKKLKTEKKREDNVDVSAD